MMLVECVVSWGAKDEDDTAGARSSSWRAPVSAHPCGQANVLSPRESFACRGVQALRPRGGTPGWVLANAGGCPEPPAEGDQNDQAKQESTGDGQQQGGPRAAER
jgi:hypothetical protein